MNTRQKERLLRLANFLEYNVSNRHFNLNVVVGKNKRSGNGAYNYLDIIDRPLVVDELCEVSKGIEPEKSCGAAACAVGWMPAVFPRLVKWDKDLAEVVFVNPDKEAEWWLDIPVDVFGISEEQADYLFHPDRYRPDHRGPKSVANRIRKFVEQDGQLPKKLPEYISD